MIKKKRQKKFIKSFAKEQLRNEQKLVKIVDILQEGYILNEKSNKCVTPENKTTKGKDTEDNRKPGSVQGSSQNSKTF